MPRKRPTEASWDSDDELLNEDTFSFSASRSKDFEEELDEDALLGSDEEVDSKPRIKQEIFAGKKPTPVKVKNERRCISPIKWEKKEEKPDEFEFEADDIELLAPDESTDFPVETSQTMDNDEETNGDDVTAEDIDEGETTHEKSHLEAEVTHDDTEDSDDDDDDRRGGRFKSERQDIVKVAVKTSKSSSSTTVIPDNLEISDEQQAQINEFMSNQKNRRKRPFQRIPPSQQFNQPRTIQTISSTSNYTHNNSFVMAQEPPPLVPQQPMMFDPPPQKPKIHVNPRFFRDNMPPQIAQSSQPMMFDSPTRSQPIPQRPFGDAHPPRMDAFRPPTSMHHAPGPRQFGHPPTSQHYHGHPPRFPPQDHRPSFFGGPPRQGPPPHIHQGQPQVRHEPPHFQHGPPRPLFEPQRHGHPGPRSFGPGDHMQAHQPRPNRFPQDPRQQPGPRPLMQFQQRNAGPQQQRPPFQSRNSVQNPRMQQGMGRGQRPGVNQQPGQRFQAPKISAQQQHSNKILQKAREARAKRFGAVQNIPVIGSTKQATKRPSTDDENASPPKMAKSAPNISTESAVKVGASDEYLKRMEEQKAMRERIQRQKELKRQIEASKRRKELQLKLAAQGKDISELDDSADSIISDDTSAPSVGRGQQIGQRGQRGQNQRGMPANRGQGQGGMPVNRGQGQRGMPTNRGQPASVSQGQRGMPANRGQTGNRGGTNAGRGQVYQQQSAVGRGNSNRGRGNLRGGIAQGRGKYAPGQTMELLSDGTVRMLEPHEIVPIDSEPKVPLARTVVPLNQQEIQNKPSQNTQDTNRQVNQPKVKRMKRIIKTKKNAKGEIISRDVIMVPLTPEEEAQALHVEKSSQVVTSEKQQPQRVVLVGDRKEITRTVIGSEQKENTRTVIASSPQKMTAQSSRKAVRVGNLSSSTSDASIRRLCSTVGAVESIEKTGKSAVVMFEDPEHAVVFQERYNRHMIDLSHITVELIR